MKKVINKRKSAEVEQIAGDYQYRALRTGNVVQRQWHKNRHNLIYFLNFLSKDETLLDAGCGSGNVIFEFHSKTKRVMGIDNNLDCISFIKKQIKMKRIKNAEVKEMNILNIKLPERYSRVIMTEVIEHFDKKNTKKLLSEVRSVMKKDGKLLITTPNYHSLWMILEKMIDIFHLTPSLWGEQHLIKFTPEILKGIVESQGFEVERIGTLNFISPFLAIFDRKLADFFSQLEFKYAPFGSLLYLVAVKK